MFTGRYNVYRKVKVSMVKRKVKCIQEGKAVY